MHPRRPFRADQSLNRPSVSLWSRLPPFGSAQPDRELSGTIVDISIRRRRTRVLLNAAATFNLTSSNTHSDRGRETSAPLLFATGLHAEGSA